MPGEMGLLPGRGQETRASFVNDTFLIWVLEGPSSGPHGWTRARAPGS